MPSWCYFG